MKKCSFPHYLFISLSVLFVVTFLSTTMVLGQTVQLPQTGQTKCYDTAGTEISCAGTGQDGEIRAGVAWPNPRFTSGTGSESECMIDNLTGLMWPKNANLFEYRTWDWAITIVNDLTHCGHSDWRLPNVNELESLVNADMPDTATWLNGLGFYNVQSYGYWSSTTPAENPFGSRTGVYMSYGDVISYTISYGNYVLPVRATTSGAAQIWKTGQTTSYKSGDDGDLETGVSWPSPRFSNHGNGTVTDNLTGLMWTKDANTPGPSACSPATYRTWQEAVDHVACLNAHAYLGYTDWRLPNRKELLSLIDWSQYDPALPSGHPFDNVQDQGYWSSTAYANYTDNVWDVIIPHGRSFARARTVSTDCVWPVRAGMVPGAMDHFDITASDGTPIGNQTPDLPFGIKLTAWNADGTIKTDCTGTVYLSSPSGNMSPLQRPLTAGGVTTITDVKIGAPGGQYIQIKATGCGLSGISNTFSVGTGCTGSIGGDIKQYKTPLTGATVTLEGIGVPYTVTSADGKYDFPDKPSGNYTLWASYNGGESDRIPVYVPCYRITKHVNVFTACNADEKTPVLLVPGIMGSTLKDHHFKSIPTLHNNGFVDPSEMEIYDENVGTGGGWKKLRETLRDAGYVDGCTLFDVPYDWRMRSEDAVQSYLRPAIISAKRKSGSTKVNIIAHSMGGLVTRSYIQSASYQNDVDRFAMIGTPNHGSAMAYPMWEGGDPISADIMGGNGAYTLATVYLAKGPDAAKSAMDYVTDIIENNLCDVLSGNFKWLCVVKDAMFFYKDTATYLIENVPSLWQLQPTYKFLDPYGELSCERNTWLDALNNSPNVSRLTTEIDTDPAKVRTKIFHGDNVQTVDNIKVALKWCSNPFYPDGIPRRFEKDSSGDGTVLASSAGLDTSVSYGEPKTEKHAKLVGVFKGDVVSFINAGQPGQSALSKKKLMAYTPVPSLAISTLGRVRPLVISPTGQKSGIENSLSINAIPDTIVSIGVDAGSIDIESPPNGTYTITLANGYAEDYELAISYADTTGATASRTARGFINAGTTSFTFTLNSSATDKIIINHTPLPPPNVIADAVDSGGLTTRLCWTASSTPGVTGYNIYAKLFDEPYLAQIGTTATTSFDTGHSWAENTSVKARLYAVSAVMAGGVESFLSNMVKNNDRDHDGVTDEEETTLGSDVSNSDSDSDGLKDGEEYLLGTNLLLIDSDSDGYSDYVEVTAGSDPMDPTVTPVNMPRYLSISKVRTGTGNVSSNPSGISCGETCGAEFATGAVVTLTATAEDGSIFAGWSGGGCSGTANCVINLKTNATITAAFILPEAPPELSPTEGTIGTQLIITGSNFGTKKGKVLIDSVATKMGKDGWTNNLITCAISKTIPEGGPYHVTIRPYKVDDITIPNAFTIRPPQIDSLDSYQGVKGDPITINGNFFGTKKGKVYLENTSTGKKKNCKVMNWDMDSITFIVPKASKKFPASSYTLKVVNKVGVATASTDFTLE